MNRRRIIFSISLLVLGFLVALFGALMSPSPVQIAVPIDRSALDSPKTKKSDAPSNRVSNEPEIVKKSVALSSAPDPRLIETTSLGHLPRKAENGERPADVYARPVDPERLSSQKSKLSIALIDMGLSQIMTAEAMISLSADVSFIMSPYASDAERQTRDIRNRGHEVFLAIQSKADRSSFEDRGPYALNPELDVDRNRDRLHWMMSRFSGYAGLIGDLSYSASQNQTLRELIQRETTSRGLSSLTLIRPDYSAPQLAPDKKGEAQQPVLLVLPGERPEDLKGALQNLAIRMKTEPRIAALVNPGPLALETLKIWIDQNRDAEFDLIPLSALLRLEGQG